MSRAIAPGGKPKTEPKFPERRKTFSIILVKFSLYDFYFMRFGEPQRHCHRHEGTNSINGKLSDFKDKAISTIHSCRYSAEEQLRWSGALILVRIKYRRRTSGTQTDLRWTRPHRVAGEKCPAKNGEFWRGLRMARPVDIQRLTTNHPAIGIPSFCVAGKPRRSRQKNSDDVGQGCVRPPYSSVFVTRRR